MKEKLSQLNLIAKGNVQGVGFRFTAEKIANRLHLVGYVLNTENGDVEVCAQGEKQQLEAFIEQIKSSFDSRYILSLDISFSLPKELYNSFSIRF